MPRPKLIINDEANQTSDKPKLQANKLVSASGAQYSSDNKPCGEEITEALICTQDTQPSTNFTSEATVEYKKSKGWSRIKSMTIKRRLKQKTKEKSNGEKKKKNDDHLGVVFMAIILIFMGRFT